MANTKRKEKMGGFDKTRPNQMTMMKSVMTKVGPGPDALLTKANEQMDEQLDDVKHMNHLMLQSKVITIRDKQLAENKSLEDEWLAEQKRLDIMMEIERLKGIKAEFEKEQNKAIATKRGAENLIDQIRERDIIRQQEAEVLEKEKVQMKANIAKAHEEEALKVKERQARVKVMQEEIKAANKAALSLKEDAKKREKQLEDEIMAHQKNKILREEAEAREVARVKEEKERETQRLRELQERANDRQAELDEIRAKKAYEAAQQKVAAERAAADSKKRALLKDLEESRRRQFRDKEMKFAEETRLEREMAMKALQRMRDLEEQER